MKTQLLLLALISSVFAAQIQGQNRTIVNAQNSEISDNLDLRVVASIFGDSRNLQEFERQLNDPQLQISNLDLNNDGQVDYLRVIESVEKRTHIVIIQSVLDRDLYQDVASIEVEKNRSNNVQIQVVGNPYFYGQNYIYEPVFFNTPLIYADFWMVNYQPYYSNWNWNFYPSNYYAWNTYPIFRYRNNVNICLNNYSNNQYNYVNFRRSSYALNVYNVSRSNGYEREHPDYAFSRRNATVGNRHDLDQIRNTRNGGVRNDIGYSQRRNGFSGENTASRSLNQRDTNSQRSSSQRDFSQNRVESSREGASQRSQRDNSQNRVGSPREGASQRSQRDYSQNRVETPREGASQRSQRDYSQNRVETPREGAPQRSQRDYSQNRVETPREFAPQKSQRDYSQNRVETPREAAPQRSQRDYSQNRVEAPREAAPQRSQRDYSQNRVETPREAAPQRSQRDYSQNRAETPREAAPQRTESSRENNSSRSSSSGDNTNSSRGGNRRT